MMTEAFFRRLLRPLLQGILAAAAIVFILIVCASRLPRAYNPLWEDEIHHHYPILAAPTFTQMRHDIAYSNKAILDFALRRFLFQSHLVTPDERTVHLVSLAIAAAHLFILLFYPWSESWGPRFVAVLFLSSCGLDYTYATEAQYYALSCLMGSVPFLALHWSLKKTWAGQIWPAAVVLLVALFLAANTNFLNAPIIGMVMLVYASAVVQKVRDGTPWKALAIFWTASAAILGRWTFWLNKYVLRTMRQAPLEPAKHPTFSVMKNSQLFSLNYVLVNAPAGLFYGAAGLSCVNRNRAERWTAAAILLALFVAKPLFYAYYSYKSDLPVYNRYLMMYLGPAVLLIGLGFSSAAGWIKQWIRPVLLQSALVAALFLYPFYIARADLRDYAVNAPAALSMWRSRPRNFSREFHFFDHARSFGAPLLVLVDHPWCSDIPLMFLQGGVGQKAPVADVQVLDVGTMPPAVWMPRARAFRDQHPADGVVVYYFETGSSHSGACQTAAKPLFRWSSAEGCLALFRPNELPPVPPLGKAARS